MFAIVSRKVLISAIVGLHLRDRTQSLRSSPRACPRHIERNIPSWGDIQILQFTDKQYENMLYYSDQGRQSQKKALNS